MSKKTLSVDINAGSIISINGGLYVVDEAIIENECFTTDQPEDWTEITIEIKCRGLRKEEFITNTEIRKGLEDDWISVEDRLPKPDTVVLIYAPYDSDGPMYTAYSENGIWYDSINLAQNDGLVTHWRYLPDAPEEEE